MNPEEYARMHALETHYWWFVGRRAIISTLLREIVKKSTAEHKQRADLRLLDLGCGTGANLAMLRAAAGACGWITALEFSPHALHFARDHLGAEQISLIQADALHLPFADGSFDVVTMLDVLEHLRDDSRALREIHRVLRPGGALVLSVPAYQSLWSAHDEALHHFRRYEYHGLGHLLRTEGFAVWRLSFAMSLMPPAAWFWRRFVLPFKPRRPREAKRHSEGAVLPAVPSSLNRALVKYLEMEGRIIARRPLNFGTSLVCVAFRK
ncbi:MAG TPA: class I SAM-dependent methyltransferase [Abditibacteriaceae bacterium]|nr:class I SAM-dependent methyltransferase [Abditibacteriaceae bacterium]